jgi:DNA repair protein RadC
MPQHAFALSANHSEANTAAGKLFLAEGEGNYRAVQSAEVVAIALEYLAARLPGSVVLDSPQHVRDFLRLKLGALPHEVFAIIHLDAQFRVLGYEEIFRGTLTETSIYPREVVKSVLAMNAAAIICCHNHPSQLATPSEADKLLTQSLKAVLAMVGVRLLDHLVVGGVTIESFAERGLL